MNKDEAMQQALELIERLNKHGWILADFEAEVYAAITALKAALEQPDRSRPRHQGAIMTDLKQAAMQQALEALSGALWLMLDKPVDEQYRVRYAYLLRVITALREALAQPVQEPVGEVTHVSDNGFQCEFNQHLPVGTKLYTTPPLPVQEPDRRALQAEGKHPAPCARHCEAKAFEIEIRSLKSALKQAQPEPPTCAWSPEDDDTMPGTYRSACGELWSFIDGGWQDNNVRFCHGCGGKVEAAHNIKEQP